MGNSIGPGQVGDWELAGLGSFLVVARASARLYFPKSHAARSVDRLAVYSENPGVIHPGLLSSVIWQKVEHIIADNRASWGHHVWRSAARRPRYFRLRISCSGGKFRPAGVFRRRAEIQGENPMAGRRYAHALCLLVSARVAGPSVNSPIAVSIVTQHFRRSG